jgi:hypothetical protein
LAVDESVVEHEVKPVSHPVTHMNDALSQIDMQALESFTFLRE